ncbi:transcription factor rf2b, partial [Phtheirospermum japonicum]
GYWRSDNLLLDQKREKLVYISELERKVQALQTEATTLSAQLTLFQRDTTGPSSENTDLKLRLQAMEQQAQLRDALNEALKHEVERLKCATSEISNSSNAFNLAMQHMPYNQSYYPSLSQSGPDKAQNVQMPQFHSLQTSMLGHHHHHLRILSDSFQQDTLSSFQGLDIGTRGPPHLVKLKARRFQLVTAVRSNWAFLFLNHIFPLAMRLICLIVHSHGLTFQLFFMKILVF